MSIETGLAGKVVIVTGGAAGIGRATALRFGGEGATVVVWDIAQSESDPEVDAERQVPQYLGADWDVTSDAAHEPDVAADPRRGLPVSGHGESPERRRGLGIGRVSFREVNVGDAAAVARAAEDVIARHGRIDVLINNAGILRDAQLVKWKEGSVASVMSEAQFDDVIDVNLRGPFLCARAVVPHMIKAGGGAIVNASSVVGLYGNFGQTNYVASKSGIIGMTRVWARELGRYNIRVNAIAPGFIDTAMARSVPPGVLDSMVSHTPLGRIGKPEELAEAYVWLASDAASYVTGAILSVDGGLIVGT